MMLILAGEPFRIRTRTYAAYYAVYTCECGNNFVYNVSHVKAGKCKGCGCKLNLTSQKTHGMCGTPTWNSWTSMLTRCGNPNVSDYSRYGGRGITVCDRWRSFTDFMEDMGLRPDGTTLDRIDVNGNYCPENCRWATHKEQANNKRNSKLLHFNGETKSLVEWAEQFGMIPETLSARLAKYGWSVDKALTTPIIATKRNKNSAFHQSKSNTEKEGRKLS